MFVYYKLAADKAARLRLAAALLSSMSTSWRFELMRRETLDEPDGNSPDQALPDDDLQTWMEVYTFDRAEQRRSDELLKLIENLACDAGVVDLIDGQRHYEVFEACV